MPEEIKIRVPVEMIVGSPMVVRKEDGNAKFYTIIDKCEKAEEGYDLTLKAWKVPVPISADVYHEVIKFLTFNSEVIKVHKDDIIKAITSM